MRPRNYLQPIELLENIRQGLNSLLGGLDATREHVPYWNCGFKDGALAGFNHSGAWDLCHDVARALHALSMAEEALGQRVDEKIMGDLAMHQLALFDEADGLPGAPNDKTGKRFVHLHNIREATHALTALARRGESCAIYWARRMFETLRQAIDENGRIHTDRLPDYVEAYNHQPSQEGRAVDALVRYYRTTGDELAIDLALRMTRFAMAHCFTPEGAVTESAGQHGHSINALVAGIADLALVTHDAGLLERVKAIYDLGLPRFNSSFGWSMESLHKFTLRGEANNTGDLLRAALLLGRGGYPEYFGQSERILRGHLLPSQLVEGDVEGFSNDPSAKEDRMRSMASRIRGGFSFPTPNDLMWQPESSICTYDITSGAVDALCETWKAIVSEGAAGIRIQLLLTGQAPGVTVRSFLSGEGRVEIESSLGRNVLVRIPSWVSRPDLRLAINGASFPLVWMGAYLLVPARGENVQRIRIEFPMAEARTEESMNYQRFTMDWRGDQMMAMSPEGKILPMFPPCRSW